ncbi:MAG: hypothetical protein EXR75_05715 [Myxococcales bacterium]|nr:hypothetical protein [Myxococcales bacterium]
MPLAATLSFGALPGCLVLDDPEFTPRVRTSPVIFPLTPATELIRATLGDGSFYNIAPFSFLVESEDVGDDLQAVLLINYGVESQEGPYRAATSVKRIAAGIGGELRGPIDLTWKASKATWDPENSPVNTSCNTVTLLVTHEFRDDSPGANCPKEIADSDTATWVVSLCNTDLSACTFDDCPTATSPSASHAYCDSEPSP